MSDVVEPKVHEDRLPGHESELEPKPDWEPRYRGSERLKGKIALITGAWCSTPTVATSPQVDRNWALQV